VDFDNDLIDGLPRGGGKGGCREERVCPVLWRERKKGGRREKRGEISGRVLDGKVDCFLGGRRERYCAKERARARRKGKSRGHRDLWPPSWKNRKRERGLAGRCGYDDGREKITEPRRRDLGTSLSEKTRRVDRFYSKILLVWGVRS